MYSEYTAVTKDREKGEAEEELGCEDKKGVLFQRTNKGRGCVPQEAGTWLVTSLCLCL